ncbi:MAG TPA: GNAT family N-acetyltransferase [Gaiellaceae bacterium]|nr:GNAT family N-acetyltransferase [Gaiellaceae bacterium]
MSVETVPYTPDRRAALVALLERVQTTQLSDEEFRWWFERNPAGEGIVSLAVDGSEVVGVAAMSFFRTALDGVERRLAIPVNVATDPRYRGRGVFTTLELRNEAAAAEAGSPLTVTFPNARSYPIFVGRLGWTDLPRLRLWARPLRASALVRYALRRPGTRGGGLRAPQATERTLHGLDVRPVDAFGPELDALARRAAAAYGSHFVRDARYLAWRYLDSPRDYRCLAAWRGGELAGVAVVGHTFKHGVSAGFLADLLAAPGDAPAVRALVGRALEEVRGGADALVLLPPPARSHRRALLASGFAPTNQRLRFIGKALHEGARLDTSRRAWHFTLGDFDFF